MKVIYSSHAWLFVALFCLLLFSGCNDASRKQPKASILTEQNIAEITNNTTLAFARSVNAGNLSLFHEDTAEDFKKKFTAQQFINAFKGFVTQKINLLAVTNLTPVFEPAPRISEDGSLVVQGYYPTTPSRVNFSYIYKQDPVEWKITGIDINVAPLP